MSRHSKNNTASSIFTYGEKQKLQEWGTIKVRVGRDSQKQFDQCELCLSRVDEPMACRKGHMYCKVCIIENLMQQKKQKDIEMRRYLQEQEERQKNQKEEQQKNTVKQVEKFEKIEMNIPEAKVTGKDLKYEDLDEEQKDKMKFIEDWQVNKKDQNTKRSEAKKDWIKTSFWAPENTPLAKDDTIAPPSKKLNCPAQDNNQHNIKLKELVKLKLEENEHKQFICWLCKQPFSHQKIAALRKCGHVMCKKCITDFVLKDGNRCTQCDAKVEVKDVIELKESGSAFASHNRVEAAVYKPSFHS